MKVPEWNYGDAYKRYPIYDAVHYANGSVLQVHDIFDGLPEFMSKADVIFTDSPWNIGNMRSFYTKAGKDYPSIETFEQFYRRLFDCIGDISPKACYLEIGKEFLPEYVSEMKRLYRHVTFYNSTYYHKKENLCYVVHGFNKRKKLHYDGVDEEDIIASVGELEDGIIGDLCMGRGLVACAAARNEKAFVGTELNEKRLSVCVERLAKMGMEAIGHGK